MRKIYWIALGVMSLSLMIVGGLSATELKGALSYNGQLISATFPGMSHGQISAYNRESHQTTTGPVDPKTNAYSLDLAAGSYNIRLIVGYDDSADSGEELPKNLVAYLTPADVGSSGPQIADMSLYYMVHVVSPFDNDDYGPGWGGSIDECPWGAEISPYFRLTWDAVPGAERYEVLVQHYACPDLLNSETIETTATAVDVSIDPSEPDTFYVAIRAYSEAELQLATMPTLFYTVENGSAASSSHWLHTLAGVGRPVHSVDSAFILQLAHLPGVGSSVWSSDLTLSNPESYAITTTLTFTRRKADGLADYTTKNYTVPARGCRTIKDVLGTLFGLENAAGSLEISPSIIMAYTRTATTGTEGSFGQFFPAVRVDGEGWASRGGGEIIEGAGIIRGAFRTNLTLAEIWGETATVEVKLSDQDGTELGVGSYNLTPFGNIQLNDMVKVLTGNAGLQLEDAQVQVLVTAGDGRVAGTLSVIAAGSNDPITVMLR